MAKCCDVSGLDPYCDTDRQREVLRVVRSTSTIAEAARNLGISERNIYARIKRLRTKAALGGFSPEHDMVHTVPDGFSVKGVSSYYGRDGELRGQWVKSQTDRERREQMLLEALQSVGEDFRGQSKAVKAPKRTKKELLTVYPFGDPHIGMYSYSKETGDDFDCAIAERNLVAAVDRLTATAPDSDTAILLSVGDYFHADTSDNRTLKSGNPLDVDTRWTRVLEVGIRAMRRCIDNALTKHRHVIVRCMSGNHDEHTSQMLGVCLKLYYENNKRVTVDTSPAYFWFHRFGKVLIGSTHGDTAKPDALPAIMADEVPEDWGDTVFRYWYTGHIHTRNVIEFRGCMWESFRTMAGRDAWHAKMGYRSGRDMYAIVHHTNFGEVERHRVDWSMVA